MVAIDILEIVALGIECAPRLNGLHIHLLKQIEAAVANAFDYEVAYEDAWIKRGGSAYMGKLYPSNATELVTMGMERIIADPRDFAVKDPDYFKLMLEIIRNIK